MPPDAHNWPPNTPGPPSLVDCVGVVHVHTTFSDGGDDIATVIDRAREAGLDFLVVSDHDQFTARDRGWEGWHDGLLVIVAAEVSAKEGHCLAFNVQSVRNYRHQPPQVFLQAIHEEGGLAFVAHPIGYVKRDLTVKVRPWRDWQFERVAGLEIWTYMHDWIQGVHPFNLYRARKDPEAFLSGPEPSVLKHWDEVGATRRIAGIGAVDSHSRRVPFNWLPLRLMTVFPLEHIFRTIRTHVQIEPFTGNAQEDIAKVLGALAQGRCFVDYLPLGDATGLDFRGYDHKGDTVLMGEERDAGNWARTLHSPIQAQWRILCDGEPLAEQEGNELTTRAPRAGVYRVEGRIAGRPWVFTNPIYLR